MIAGTIKRRLHRDICSDPVLHGLVLNLYLNGEEFPHRADDYFPVWAVEDADLLSAMQSHMRDEDKHVALYRKAIKKIDQPIVELPIEEIYNSIIRRYTPQSFLINKRDKPDQRTFKLANFLAHLHFLEKRIARSLEFHLEGCSSSPSDYSEKAVGIVFGDETHHVQYTREAVFHLLPSPTAKTVLDEHRQAEARANLDFSSQQLSMLTSNYADHFPRARSRIYRHASALLEWGLKYA
ncbi:MAG: hypothetical protein ACR2QT_03020 [Woeseiaceae bacterium]